MEFRALASGSGGNCYVVSAPGAQPLMIDCGIRYADIQVALAHKVSSLAGCLISHSHGDHCSSARKVALAGVDLYSGSSTLMMLAKDPSVPIHRLHRLEAKVEKAIGGWRVLPFDVPHDVPCLGFVVGAPDGERMVYLSDAAFSPFTFPPCEIYAIEANWSEDLIRAGVASGAVDGSRFSRTVRSHMSIERCIELLRANDLSRCREVVLLHLSAANSSAVEFRRMVERETGVPCRVADAREMSR